MNKIEFKQFLQNTKDNIQEKLNPKKIGTKISVNLKTVFKGAASDEEKTFLHFRFDPDRLGYRLFLPRSQRTSARRRKRKLYQF